MAPPGSLPPTPARLRRAHAAGIRPGRGAWVAGAAAFAAAAALSAAEVRGWDGPRTGGGLWPRGLEDVGRLGVAAAAAGTLLVLLVLSGGRLDPVDDRLRPAFAGVRVRISVLARAGCLLLGGAIAAAGFLGAVAASARAVDAPPKMWPDFIWNWYVRGAAWTGAGLAALGAVARIAERRAIRRGLFQTPAERRAEARTLGRS